MFSYYNLLKSKFNSRKLNETFNSIFLINGVVHYETKTEKETKYFILDSINKLVLHREDDLPAHIILYKDNKGLYTKREEIYFVNLHYKNGKLHRDNDKPAVYNHIEQKDKYLIYSTNEFWFKNGKLHRENNNHALRISFDHDFHLKLLNIENIINEDHKNLHVLVYLKNGLIHREFDNPAYIVESDFYKAYYVNGKLHRDNSLPALLHYPTFDFRHYNTMKMAFARANVNHLLQKRLQVQSQQPTHHSIKDQRTEEFYLFGNKTTKDNAILSSKLKGF